MIFLKEMDRVKDQCGYRKLIGYSDSFLFGFLCIRLKSIDKGEGLKNFIRKKVE